MTISQIFAGLLALFGGKVPEGKESDYNSLVSQAEKLTEKPVDTLPSNLQEMIKASVSEATRELVEQNKALSQALAEEKAARTESVKTLEEKNRQELTAKVQAAIDDAIKAGKIEPKNEELINVYKKQLAADYDSGKKILDSLPGKPASQDGKENQGKPPAASDSEDQGMKIMNDAAAAFAATSKN